MGRISSMALLIALMMALLAALAAGCDGLSATQIPTPAPVSGPSALPIKTLRLEPTLGGMEFDSPTNFVQDPDGRLWITEQEGIILEFDAKGPRDELAFSSNFLDIRDRVSDNGWEEGLLGMALDPSNRRQIYLYYSAANPRRSVVSRYTLAGEDGGAWAAPDSALTILEVEQPYPNHNGGQIAFGPDGYLYIGLGDGGSAGDPRRNGQDTSTMLGTILRIDVSQATVEQPYAIPPDNPFADGGGRPEIWAYGLRNPWRFSFDRDSGELWAGDVGQDRWEEIDVIERGGNYGWNAMEGSHCFRPQHDCPQEGMIPPVWEYSLEDGACSVTGGYVYRGAAIPWLNGVYVYGDFCSGQVFGLRREGADFRNYPLADTGLRITAFGQDNAGELYVLSQSAGIFRLVAEP